MSDEIIAPAPEASAVAPTQESVPGASAQEETPRYDVNGTQMTAEELLTSYQNLLPEFTRKSQELSAAQQKLYANTNQASQPAPEPWKDPNWVPQDWSSDIINPIKERITQEVWQDIENHAMRVQQQEQERAQAIQQEINSIKSVDPNVDPNRVIAHATKYQFPNLTTAYQNMKVMEDTARITEERVLKNLTNRSQVPVGQQSTAGQTAPQFPPDVRTGWDKARYVLRNNNN